jgi:hypothetical protein
MNSQQHAIAVAAIVGSLTDRILGPGADQYDDGSGVQRFEKRALEDIRTDAVEEIDDLIVYLCQLRLRLTQGPLSDL